MSKARREGPYHYTEADRRYGEVLGLLKVLVEDHWDLIRELDSLVGERLCEAEDRMAPKCTRGRYR